MRPCTVRPVCTSCASDVNEDAVSVSRNGSDAMVPCMLRASCRRETRRPVGCCRCDLRVHTPYNTTCSLALQSFVDSTVVDVYLQRNWTAAAGVLNGISWSIGTATDLSNCNDPRNTRIYMYSLVDAHCKYSLSSPYEKVLTSSKLDILWKLAILWRRSISVHLLSLCSQQCEDAP